MRILSIFWPLLLAPLLLGLINRTKAFFAGRTGQPLFQAYFDIGKLLQKGAVYSRTTSWIFRTGPIIGLAAILMGLTMVPFGQAPTLFSFQGDFILLACLLGLARFFMVLAAWDTGSSFEGMGASREVTFSLLAEPIFFLAMVTLTRLENGFSLSEILNSPPLDWPSKISALMLVTIALFVILLAENARIPIDDPNTHLELTMIHEVMALDHGGPDLAFILYGSTLKLWIFEAILVGVMLPVPFHSIWISQLIFLIGMALLSIFIGVVESVMARLRLSRVSPLLVGAAACALFALLLGLRRSV